MSKRSTLRITLQQLDKKIPDEVREMTADEFRRYLKGRGEIPLKQIMPSRKHSENLAIKAVQGQQVRDVSIETMPGQIAFFIPGEVPSLKNGKRILRKKDVRVMNGPDGRKHLKQYRYYIGSKEIVLHYVRSTGIYYQRLAEEFRKATADIDGPIRVEMLFIRKTTQRFDFNNISQLVCDRMTAYGWVIDDSVDHLLAYAPLTGPVWLKDKDNPGVRITVLRIRATEQG